MPNGENGFFAVCYDRNILEYEKKGDNWEIKKTITVDTGKKSAPAGAQRNSAVSDALKKIPTNGSTKKRKFSSYFKTIFSFTSKSYFFIKY